MLKSPPIPIFRLDRPINAGARRLICTSRTIRRGGERELEKEMMEERAREEGETKERKEEERGKGK